MKTGQQLLTEARARIREITVREARERYQRNDGSVFFDVRDPNEVNLGRIPGAVHVSRGNVESKVEALIPRDAHVIVYCARGNRSAFVADVMQQMGYADVVSLDAGFTGWVESGGDVEG
jgi:sulfur-carrier protein adenylyltransferase/sulfurtransferase